MTQVTHIRRVTPAHFANWLVKRTANIYAERFPTERGRISMQPARTHHRGNWNIPTEVVIEGCYIYPHETDRNAEVATRFFDCIRFELTPLDETRTEITTVCNESTPILAYCDELIVEMELRWQAEVQSIQHTVRDAQPVASGAASGQTTEPTTPAQSPKLTDAPKTTNWSRGEKIALIGIIITAIALIVAIAVALFQFGIIQDFMYAATPSLTPTLVFPTATP